jgi:hypothetical protein
MSDAVEQDRAGDTFAAEVDALQEVRPVADLQGHEVCADVHVALTLARAVVDSRDRRVASSADAESSDTLLRELRAVGVTEAAPQLIAMVALVDTAVHLLADAGARSQGDAWEQLRKEVLRKHCQAPDSL